MTHDEAVFVAWVGMLYMLGDIVLTLRRIWRKRRLLREVLDEVKREPERPQPQPKPSRMQCPLCGKTLLIMEDMLGKTYVEAHPHTQDEIRRHETQHRNRALN